MQSMRTGALRQAGWHGSTKPAGPILFSAAYQDNTIYFASNDSYAYALNAGTGALVWKSAKLPGAGFASWWPVIAGNQVVFAGSAAHRARYCRPGAGDLDNLDTR